MRIGVLYNLVDSVAKGKDIEKIADNEVLDIALAIEKVLEKRGHQVTLIRVNTADFSALPRQFDCIFNLAEGLDGDVLAEPMIARRLKESGVAFTGCGEESLALCLDKVKAKETLLKAGINTPRHQLFTKESDKLEEALRFPLIVKPVHEDASVGITKDSVVFDEKGLATMVAQVLGSYKQPALVEEFIDGREINAALLGNPDGEDPSPQVLPLSEIVFDLPEGMPRIVSFDAKWVEDSPEYKGTIGKCPAIIPEKMAEKIISDARKAFRIMKCSGYARVDFRVRGDEVFVLEVNPNPCINPDGSGFVRSADAAGYSFDNLILKIIELAVSDGKNTKSKL
jgi:D-alanine-D-alanine ligase